MPAKYKLSYFDIRGRAEMIRLAFAAAGVEFEDCRVKSEDWAALKPKTPQGALPTLEVDGIVLCQSFTIARYVAREFNLYGKNNIEAAQIDMILDTTLDISSRGLRKGSPPWVRESDPEEQAKKKADFMAEDGAPKTLGQIERAIEKFGSNGFAVSDSLSIADLVLYGVLEFWRLKDSLKGCPKIAAVLKSVEKNEKIAKYLKERPERPF